VSQKSQQIEVSRLQSSEIWETAWLASSRIATVAIKPAKIQNSEKFIIHINLTAGNEISM
jgi:hypothetical protein